MRINLGFVLNIIDDLQSHLTSQDYITCMNTLRDANKIVKNHEDTVCSLWRAYYELKDENEFYVLLLEFIDSHNMSVPLSFEYDKYKLALANDYVHNLNDSDDDHDKIDYDVITYLQHLRRIKIKYETFMLREHPELIDRAAKYIMQMSSYNDFEFCGRDYCFDFDEIEC